MSVNKTDNGRWVVNYRDNSGKQQREYFGRGDEAKKQAEARNYEIKAAKKLGNLPEQEKQIYFLTLAQAYLDDRRANGASESYIYDLKNLLNGDADEERKSKKKGWISLLSHKPVDKLSYQEDILPIMATYKDRSQATRNRYCTYLRAIFNFGLRAGMVKSSPMKAWRRPKEEKRQSLLTVPDLVRLIEHASPHLKWAIEVAYFLGTRPGESELFALKWQDIQFDQDVIHIYGRKTKEPRKVPLNPEFKKRLLEMREKAQTEFLIEYKGRPIKKLRRSFATARKRAGIEYPVCMYSVRHLFGTMMYRNLDRDVLKVAELLGCSPEIAARNYIERTDEENEKIMNALPSIYQALQQEKEPEEIASTPPTKIIPFRSRTAIC